MLRVESFTVGTAESRMVQLSGGGASAITEAYRPYCGTLPLLTQPAIAEATHHNRETPPTGQSLQQQGEAHGNRAKPTATGQSPQQ